MARCLSEHGWGWAVSKPLRFMDACPRCSGPIVAKQCLDETCSLGRMGQNEQELTIDLEHAESERDALLKAAKDLLAAAQAKDESDAGDYYAEQHGGYPEHFFDGLKAAIAKVEADHG